MRPALLAAAPLLACLGGVALLGDLARRLEAALALLAAAFLALAWAARRLGRAWAAGQGSPAFGARCGAIVVVAAGLRLVLLPLPPTLSADLDRYLWDGRVVAAGGNPYRSAPAAPELAGLRDERWERLHHREVPTVYPPLALGLFALAAVSPAPVLAWKAMVVAADLAGCLLLARLARRLGVPVERSVWYAWNPLVVLETAGMGHLDAVGVAAAVAAVLALVSARTTRAAWAAAAGALIKLVPAVAFPLWARASGRPRRFLATAGGLAAAIAVPVLLVSGWPPGLATYAVSWEFNGPLFEPLWRLLAEWGAASTAARAVDRLKDWTGLYRELNHLYPYLYPQFLAKVLLACGMLTAVVRSWRPGEPARATGRLFGGLLLCSATAHPWYLLWVLPWAALARHTAWLAASALVLLSYLPQHRPVPLWPGIYGLVWLPVAALALLERGRRSKPAAARPAELPAR